MEVKNKKKEIMNINIEELIKAEIKDMDLALVVREVVTSLIGEEVQLSLRDVIQEESKRIISGQIALVLESPIETDDGWGKREKWESFEVLFKTKFLEKINSHYEMKKTIESQVKARVESLFANSYKEISNKIANELTNAGGNK